MGLYKRRDSPYWWAWLEGAKPKSTGILIHGGSPEQDKEQKRRAQRIYTAWMGDLAYQRAGLPVAVAPMLFETFAQWYDTHRIATHRGAAREREILTTLRRTFDGQPLTAITRQAVEEWRTHRATQIAARTVNLETNLLKAILFAAVGLGHLTSSPLAGLKPLPIVVAPKRLMSHDEEQRLLKAASDAVDRALLLLALDSLVRLNDVLDVTRRDDRGEWMYIRDPKGRQAAPYEVPLSPRTRKALDKIPGKEPYYFERYRHGTDLDRRRRIAYVLKRLCQKAEIPYGRKQHGITFHHATRTTGATKLIVSKGIDPKTVQSIGNWKRSAVLMDIYVQRDREQMRRAVGLPSALRRDKKAANR
jgi:integrase